MLPCAKAIIGNTNLELLDQIGVAWFVDKLQAENLPVPALLADKRPLYQVSSSKLTFANLSGNYQPVHRAEGVLLLSDVKLQNPAVLSECIGQFMGYWRWRRLPGISQQNEYAGYGYHDAYQPKY